MSRPTNRALYDSALEMIRAGKWRVDAESGVIYGRGGRRIGHRRPTGGYPVVAAPVDGTFRSAYLHRIIYESVHGPTDAGIEINHINGDKGDNRITNLEAVTPSQNISHALRTGLIHLRLTAEQVGEIRRRFSGPNKENRASLAAEFGISPNTVSDIAYGRRWARDGEGEVLRAPGFTWEQVCEIREKRSAGRTLGQLAKEYGVGRSTIARITTFKRWTKPLKRWAA